MDYVKRLLENRKRDRRIVALVASGKTQTEVARKFGLHRQHVGIILKKAKANGAKAVRPEGS